MSSPKLISISGSVHSGKTTVSRLLAAEQPNAAYLDEDLLAAWVREKYPPDATIDDILPEVHQRIIEITAANLRDGRDVIIDYPLTDKVHRQFLETLGDIKYEAHWFLLKPDIAKVLTGSKTRPQLNDWETERIKYHYGSDLMKTNLAVVIDSTHQIPEETVKEISAKIRRQVV